MSFDEIILPPSVIAAICKQNLVEIGDESAVAGNKRKSDVPIAAIKFLGKNLKNVIVLVNYPDDVFIPEEQLEFLSKILLACKLDMGDIAIINTSKYPSLSFDDLTTMAPRYILVFGDCPATFVDHDPDKYFVASGIEGANIITAPALEKFYRSNTASKQLKSKLWVSLQQFFNLS